MTCSAFAVQQPGPSGSLGLKPGMGSASICAVVDEDDCNPDDKSVSAKHVAAIRFRRNHLLMKEILEGSRVPTPKATSITDERVTELRNQVKLLEKQHKEVETEIAKMETSFEANKRKIRETSSQFEAAMKRLCQVSTLRDDVSTSDSGSVGQASANGTHEPNTQE
ncbi:uncharacterized protein LOC134183392 isoform X2 [Corticium candelabrum]|uniref:uncharacterized protein LOC134183392 isoform X2 n=1 Tax=Corticium candelabrum TaxID=121492 RepID=UPI002E25AAC6|nr:uncharacterized protein LOC134183392 isoform X2 [Corticium candelabrum]